ncbi:MAG: Fe-only nitrogenase accessory protein AnfO [Breznakibacter sp.]
MKIAVFLDDYRQILPFYGSGIVEIFSGEGTVWKRVDQIAFDMSQQIDLADLQFKINMLTSEFEDCNLLIVENIKGLPAALLQEKGIGIWNFSGLFLPELLGFVKDELDKALAKPEKTVARPVLTGSKDKAEYEVDLAALLSQDRGLNSMDILIPFMKETNFKKLRIRCSHLPKWFHKALEAFGLVAQIEQAGPELFIATVSPAHWDANIDHRRHIQIPGMGGGCSSGGC